MDRRHLSNKTEHNKIYVFVRCSDLHRKIMLAKFLSSREVESIYKNIFLSMKLVGICNSAHNLIASPLTLIGCPYGAGGSNVYFFLLEIE